MKETDCDTCFGFRAKIKFAESAGDGVGGQYVRRDYREHLEFEHGVDLKEYFEHYALQSYYTPRYTPQNK